MRAGFILRKYLILRLKIFLYIIADIGYCNISKWCKIHPMWVNLKHSAYWCMHDVWSHIKNIDEQLQSITIEVKLNNYALVNLCFCLQWFISHIMNSLTWKLYSLVYVLTELLFFSWSLFYDKSDFHVNL